MVIVFCSFVFVFLKCYMRDMEYSVKSLTNLYTYNDPNENYHWLPWNLGHKIQKEKVS